MKPDNIMTTTHERIGTNEKDVCHGRLSFDGNHCRGYSWVGYVPQNAGYVLCTDCALDEYDESHISENFGGVIQSNDKWDFPGAICKECGNRLDTYLLVYRDQDPELWHKLVWSQQVGELSDPITDDEKLAKLAENQAYKMGWQEGETIANQITQAEAENNPRSTEYPTDSAHYANNVAPELRALAGYIDDGSRGTYRTAFRDVSHVVYNEGVDPAFHDGFYDRIMNNRDKWESRQQNEINE